MFTALVLAATLTIQDYATLPQPSSPRWSPDGKRIVYVLTKADLEKSAYDSNLRIVDADGKNDRQLTFARGADFRPRWSPDGRLLAFVSDRDGRNALWLIDPDGGEARKLVDPPTPLREFEWSPDGKSIAFSRLDEPAPEQAKRAEEKDDARVVGEGAKRVHLHVADVASGDVRRLTSGELSIWTFQWSPNATEIAFDRGPGIGLDDLYHTDIYSVNVESGELRPLVVQPGSDRSPVYSPDGKWLAFTTWGGVHDWLLEQDVHVMPAGGGESRNVSKAYDRTPEAIFWSDSQLYVEGPHDTTTQLYRVDVGDPREGTRWTDTTRAEGVIGDAHVHRGRAVYVYQSTTEPPELFVDGKRLTHHNDAYRDRDLGETRVIRWKNPKDGLEIEGLLTLPVGYESGRVPLLTFVHGGPASRFDQGYLGYLGHIYAPQVLAAHGFAVLRPNPRGTGGYGEAFRRANRGDWGGMDWIDINAGIDKVIADGIADPDRLGLMGWSYGGYMAAWALGHSDRFKAVSVGAPVVDLLSFHGTADIRDFIPSYFGPVPASLDTLRAHSPLWHLKKTNAKVLIQHGEADDRVPLSQGTMLYRMLDELGVDVTMVTYPRTPHVPREPKLRMDIMRRNLELFRDAF